jgi:hypothetical protein
MVFFFLFFFCYSSSLSSLVNPFTPEGRAIKEAKEAQNPSYRKMLEEATMPKNWNAHTIQALIRQPPASGSIYRLLFEELEVSLSLSLSFFMPF